LRVPFLRLARDERGYETTMLLHASHPGERARVLYWYRSAPGIRVGRPALDEDAIRTIEDQHPEIEFDWPHILEVGAAMPIEVERRPERGPRDRESERRRKAARSTEPVGPVESLETLPANDDSGIDTLPANGEALEPEAPAHVPDMLAELVGRDIATRLRARYAEITARIHQMDADDATRAAWQTRAEPLNPDSWITPDEILAGVSRADELFDNLRRALLG
jgi:hypothetical protein